MAKVTNYKELSPDPTLPLSQPLGLLLLLQMPPGTGAGPVSDVTALPSCGQAEHRR